MALLALRGGQGTPEVTAADPIDMTNDVDDQGVLPTPQDDRATFPEDGSVDPTLEDDFELALGRSPVPPLISKVQPNPEGEQEQEQQEFAEGGEVEGEEDNPEEGAPYQVASMVDKGQGVLDTIVDGAKKLWDGGKNGIMDRRAPDQQKKEGSPLDMWKKSRPPGYSDGGEVEEDDSEEVAPSKGDWHTEAMQGVNDAQDHLYAKHAVNRPMSDPSHKADVMAMLSGHGAIDHGTLQALRGAVDPQGQMTEADRNMAVISLAKKYYDENGPEGATIDPKHTRGVPAVAAIMQALRKEHGLHAAMARVALQKGAHQSAARHATTAFAAVPDGSSTIVRAASMPQGTQSFDEGGEVEETERPSLDENMVDYEAERLNRDRRPRKKRVDAPGLDQEMLDSEAAKKALPEPEEKTPVQRMGLPRLNLFGMRKGQDAGGNPLAQQGVDETGFIMSVDGQDERPIDIPTLEAALKNHHDDALSNGHWMKRNPGIAEQPTDTATSAPAPLESAESAGRRAITMARIAEPRVNPAAGPAAAEDDPEPKLEPWTNTPTRGRLLRKGSTAFDHATDIRTGRPVGNTTTPDTYESLPDTRSTYVKDGKMYVDTPAHQEWRWRQNQKESARKDKEAGVIRPGDPARGDPYAQPAQAAPQQTAQAGAIPGPNDIQIPKVFDSNGQEIRRSPGVRIIEGGRTRHEGRVGPSDDTLYNTVTGMPQVTIPGQPSVLTGSSHSSTPGKYGNATRSDERYSPGTPEHRGVVKQPNYTGKDATAPGATARAAAQDREGRRKSAEGFITATNKEREAAGKPFVSQAERAAVYKHYGLDDFVKGDVAPAGAGSPALMPNGRVKEVGGVTYIEVAPNQFLPKGK